MSRLKNATPWKVGLGVVGVACLAAVLLAGASGTARASSAGTGPPVDHQLCYAAAGVFRIPPQVQLFDQFNPNGFTPQISGKANLLCNPVVKTVAPTGQIFRPQNPLAHLICYPMVAPNAQPNPKVVLVGNQFGQGYLAPGPANALCVPSWKTLLYHAKRTVNTPKGLNHFTCYPVNQVGGVYQPPPLFLKDEFTKAKVPVDVNPVPAELCLPAQKIIGVGAKAKIFPIINPILHLLCYNVSKTPIKNPVYTQNQFGMAKMHILNTQWLCLPSTKQIIVPAG